MMMLMRCCSCCCHNKNKNKKFIIIYNETLDSHGKLIQEGQCVKLRIVAILEMIERIQFGSGRDTTLALHIDKEMRTKSNSFCL